MFISDIGRYKLWPPANAESLLLPTNTSLNASLPTVPPTRQTPTGDGELFQLVCVYLHQYQWCKCSNPYLSVSHLIYHGASKVKLLCLIQEICNVFLGKYRR